MATKHIGPRSFCDQRFISLILFLAYSNIAAAQHTSVNAKLIAAVDANRIAEVRSCLRHGANPNARIGISRKSSNVLLLSMSVMEDDSGGPENDQFIRNYAKNREPITILLVRYGASINYHFSWRHTTPLMVAAARQSERTVDFLFKHRADVNAVDVNGWTPLMYALFRTDSKLAVVRELLKRGSDPNVLAKGRVCPLLVVRGSDHLDCVRELIKYGAEVNAVDPDGHTILSRMKGYQEFLGTGPQDTLKLIRQSGGRE